MSQATRQQRIDEYMERASEHLSHGRWFDAETAANEALKLARAAQDFARAGRIVLPLLESRRQRLQLALDVPGVTCICELWPEGASFKSGCYLIAPPLVGADARRLKLLSLEQKVPVAVLCREPRTMLGLCPVVTIAPGATIRTRVDPPDDEDDPDPEWFARTLEDLGEFAVSSLDPGLSNLRRLDTLLLRLDAHPESEAIHLAIAQSCAALVEECARRGVDAVTEEDGEESDLGDEEDEELEEAPSGSRRRNSRDEDEED